MNTRTNIFGYLGMLYICFISVLPVGWSIKILNIEGPGVVVNGSNSQVVLDCDYDISDRDKKGLVVKWFFNRQPYPVYQWIPQNVPQDLSILKGRLNLDYEVSQDQFEKHRALAIQNPTTDLSGEYTCWISTFEGEAYERKDFIVYAPADDLSMTYSKPSEDSVIVTCRGGGIFPEPDIAIYKSSSRDQIEGAKIQSKYFKNLGYYNVSIELRVSDYDLDSETIFECILTIPGTEYRVQEEILYFPGPPTTETTIPEDGDELFEQYENIEYVENFIETDIEEDEDPHTAESVSGGERVVSSLVLLSVLLGLLHQSCLH